MTKVRAILRRRWPLLVITTIIGVVAGMASVLLSPSSSTRDAVFTATQTIVANPGSGANPLIPQDELRITRGAVPVKAAALLGQPDAADELAGRIDTAFVADSSSLTISSNDLDPKVAEQRVDAFVQAFLDVINTNLQANSKGDVDQTQTQLDAATKQLADFDATHPEFTRPGAVLANDAATQQLGDERSQIQNNIQQLTQKLSDAKQQLSRTVPYSSLGPEKPKPAASGLVSVPTSLPLRAMLLGSLGLLLGGLVAMVIERVNRRIDTREELAESIDLPILAEIGYLKASKRAHEDDGVLKLEGIWAEPYRRVRSAIQFVQATHAHANGSSNVSGEGAQRPHVFMMTSTSPGEGKSTSTVLTGQALAETGEPTVVIGGDFRRPEIERLLGATRDPSIYDMARMTLDRPTVDDVVHTTRFESLYVAPAGRGTREVAGSIEAAKEIAQVAVERGATVLIDSSPIQAANDTVDLLPVVDYVILVVRSGRSTEASILEVVDTLQRMEAKILGVLLIGTPTAGRQQSYYYDYYAPSAAPSDGESLGPSGFTAMADAANDPRAGVAVGAIPGEAPSPVDESASAPPPWSG